MLSFLPDVSVIIMDILFKRNDINKDDEEARNTSQTLTVLLGVVLGVATVILSCFLYVQRCRRSDQVRSLTELLLTQIDRIFESPSALRFSPR